MKASIAPRRKNAGSLEFLQTDEQRSWVEKMAGMRMTQDEICQVIINPETGEHISRPTLAKAFAVELATGRSKLQHKIGLKYHERLDAGDWNAIQAGLRHMFKWWPASMRRVTTQARKSRARSGMFSSIH